MFTGIITDVGRIEAAEAQGDLRLRIATHYDVATVDLGASIACSGVCLTVVGKSEGWFAVDLSQETLGRTAPDLWREGGRLNLERALRVGDELGGHIVTGHVDGLGEIVSAQGIGGSTMVRIAAPPSLAPYIAPKGSIALDGVSLTVNEVAGDLFSINVIPHTARETTLDRLPVGRKLHIEIDILARYLGRMMEMRSAMADYPLDIRRT